MNRRQFLHRSTLASVALFAPGLSAANAALPQIVDTHTHFYDPTRPEGIPWPGKGSPLYRTVLPRDWLAVANPLGITHTVVVEASNRLEDNAWILDLAAREKGIVGFVGNLLLHDPDFEKHLRRFAAHPIFRGLRVAANDLRTRIDAADFRRGLTLLADLGLSLDVNGPPSLLATIAKLATDFPSLRIVVDHVGSAGDPARLTAEWRDGIHALTARTNVFCKISALIEQTAQSSAEYGKAPRDTAYYAPILDTCWRAFGEDRVIYGSNWPVSEKGGSYADQFRIVSEYFAQKAQPVREKFFSKNSRLAYRWIERP
jgi:L-fuconolactonase